MSDFIDMGSTVLRKSIITSFSAYEKNGKFIFQIYMDKQKQEDGWFKWTLDTKEEMDVYVKYTKAQLGLAVQQEGIEEDEEDV